MTAFGRMNLLLGATVVFGGCDAALHVVSRYLGEDGARQLAKDLEYDWRAD